jgi:hypothetical protein
VSRTDDERERVSLVGQGIDATPVVNFDSFRLTVLPRNII